MTEATRRAERRLARSLIEARPMAAAAALEASAPADAAEVLLDAAPEAATRVLGWMVPGSAAAILGRMPAADAEAQLAGLPPHPAAAILRRMPPATRDRMAESLPPDAARAVRRLLEYPDGTAGALMDPRVLALPAELDVRAARRRALEHAAEAHYNVYVVERDGALAGVLNLRELFAADGRALLRAVMNEATHRIRAGAERLEVISHPGWKHVHSLPVVDDGARFLGAIRFRTLRELEEEVFRRVQGNLPSTGRALGELYWTGVAGMLEAMVGALAPGRGDSAAEGEDREPRA